MTSNIPPLRVGFILL